MASMSAKIKVNSSLYDDFDKLGDSVTEEVELVLRDIANTAIDESTWFVDTGTYITSFSFATGSGRPRGGSSHGKPRKQSQTGKAAEGKQLLYQDIDQLDLTNTTVVTLRNGSTHASFVEYKQGKLIFENIGNKYG